MNVQVGSASKLAVSATTPPSAGKANDVKVWDVGPVDPTAILAGLPANGPERIRLPEEGLSV